MSPFQNQAERIRSIRMQRSEKTCFRSFEARNAMQPSSQVEGINNPRPPGVHGPNVYVRKISVVLR
jgi:hypothetical protein